MIFVVNYEFLLESVFIDDDAHDKKDFRNLSFN